MRVSGNWFPIFTTILPLIFPAMLNCFVSYEQKEFYQVSKQPLVSLLFFLTPLVFFYRNVKVYFYLLLPLILLTPLFLFFIFFGVSPGYKMIVFILQTNPREALEAASRFIFLLVPFQVLYVIVYLFFVHRIPSTKISLKWSACVSGVSFLVLSGIICYENRLHLKSFDQISRRDVLLAYDYPFSLLSGLNKAIVFLKRNNLKKAEDFVFHATRSDTLKQRQVYILIIGESSRYDRWQINGYERPTSPGLAAQENLITYSDVIAGAHFTRVSVPQIITRANPDNFDVQFQEKSILCAFDEAGFKTLWLSNQSDDDIFWSGSTVLHAKTADISMFSPTYSPNLDFENVYDGRLLPVLDSILNMDDKNLFIVLHTMGNHWDYSRRYPPEFDLFKPSTKSVKLREQMNREAILNAYDNSILYADFFIDSVIKMVNAKVEIAAVTFISDHGEDLFEVHPDKLNFHFRPSTSTLKVPLFIWTSESYKNAFPENRNNLENNRSKKVGPENIFTSVLDIANIRFKGFDSTKSFASKYFQPSKQKFYDDEKRLARLFKELKR